MTARAVIYVRQSLYREESISLEVQERACREYAASRGYVVTDVLSDPGISGLQFARRPGVRRAIETVERRRADVLVVWRWSRLSRKRTDQAVILDRIERAGGRAESATEPVDATTAGGRFSREVLLAAAAFESDTKSEQWKEAQARRVALGLPGGGAAPIGYRSAGKGRAFVPDEVLGPLVRGMYEAYLRGRGPQAIAKELNDAEHRTPRGRPFSVMTVTRVLDSGFAAGYLVLDVRRGAPRHVRGAHEPLIDEATWIAYRRERDRRRQVHPKARQPRWPLGGGLTTCGLCGTNMFVNSYDDPNGQVICSRYKNTRTCAGVWINRARLDGQVAWWLVGHTREWADRTDELTGAGDERDRLAKLLDAARAEEDQLGRGRRDAARLLALGEVEEDDYRAAVREADARRAEVAEAIIGIEAQLDVLSPTADVLDRIERGSAGMTTEEWSAVLRRLIRRISVTPTEVVLTSWHGEPVTWDRTVMTPRRPSRGDRETARGPNGRFALAT